MPNLIAAGQPHTLPLGQSLLPPSLQQPQAPHPSRALQDLVYALQAADSVNSANLFRNHPGTREMDPMMAPFSHGGALTMAAGFGLSDILRNILTRHASPGAQNNAAAMQALANVIGIGQTDATRRRLGP